MVMKSGLFVKDKSGASLLEVMIAMVILTVGFLGVMALALALTNNNSTAGKINTATTIAQSQVSQLNYLGTSMGTANIETNFVPSDAYGSILLSTVCPDNSPNGSACYEYEISPEYGVPNSALTNVNYGITLPYTVMFILYGNSISAGIINGTVEVCWQDGGLVCRLDGGGQNIQHIIEMNDVIM
jgi:hypothetical protein